MPDSRERPCKSCVWSAVLWEKLMCENPRVSDWNGGILYARFARNESPGNPCGTRGKLFKERKEHA